MHVRAMSVWLSMCSGKTRKDLEVFFMLVLEDLHKQEVKTKAKLSAVWLNLEAMPQNIHKAPWQRLGDLQVLSV